MRLIAVVGMVVSLGFAIQAEETTAEAEVEQRLLAIELESYYDAYKEASASIRKLDSELALTVTPQERATLKEHRDRLRAHLDALAGQAKEIAARIRKTELRAGKNNARPKGAPLHLRNRLRPTGRDLDIAIAGRGFFQLFDPDTNSMAYTRFGKFDLDSDGNLVAAGWHSRFQLMPSIQIPNNAMAIVISKYGRVSVRVPSEVELKTLGQLQLWQFVEPDGLKEIGEDLFSETVASGAARSIRPGEVGAGTIRQRNLEINDADEVRTLIEMLVRLLSAQPDAEPLLPR
jgi:flagellar basal body rod protein FlgG